MLWADFFAESAVNAADHVDVKALRTLFYFCPLVIAWDLFRMDGDGARRADKFTKLAGHAAFAILLVCDESWGTAIVLRHMIIPFLFGILHGDLFLSGYDFEKVSEGHSHAFREGGKVQVFPPFQFWAFTDDCHGSVGVEGLLENDEEDCGQDHVEEGDLEKEDPDI